MTSIFTHRFLWLSVSVLLGLGFGYLMRVTPEDLKYFGNSLNNQSRFEAALVERIGDQPRFKEVRIRRCHVPGLGDVDVVSGLYCNGRPEKDQAYHWKPSFYVAAIPYRPAGENEQHVVPGIRDFLNERKVPFVHAWWRSYSVTTWLIASIVMVGMIWPALLTKLVCGQWTRPASEKGISLWNVRSTPTIKVKVNQPSFAGTREVRAEAKAPNEESELPLPTFTTKASTSDNPPAIAATDRQHAEFGAKPDDFYPTEKRHQAHRESLGNGCN